MPISRRLQRITGSAVAAIAALLLVDAGFAINAEKNLARHIETQAKLEATPWVNLGGYAYTSSFFTGQWSSVNSRIRDVEVPGFGLVSLEYGATNVEIPKESVLSGIFTESPTEQYFTKLRLDGLALGAKMGLTDLVIANYEDSSPAGGWETEAVLEATVPGWQAPATVMVELRIVAGNVTIRPREILSAPDNPDSALTSSSVELNQEHRREILATFTQDLPGAELPLGIPPTRIFTSGGSITIEGENILCTVSAENFMPPTTLAAQTIGTTKQELPESNCRNRRH